MRSTLRVIDPLTPFEKKKSKEFGLEVAKQIAEYWFKDGIVHEGTTCEYNTRRQYIVNKRKFVRNEVSVKHLKDRLSKSKTDLKYLNLNFKTKNIAKKFCLTVINGISDENYILDIQPTDHLSITLKQEKEKEYRTDMLSKEMYEMAKQELGLDLTKGKFIPNNEEELQIQLQIKDRPKIKIAEEILINYIKETNDWNIIEQQKNKDLVEIGIAVVRVYTDKNDGVKIAYVNPENYVHSYNENSPNFKDKFYEGVVEEITISDLIRESDLSDNEIQQVICTYGFSSEESPIINNFLGHKVQVLRYAYKTHKRIVYKQKKKFGKVVKITKKNDQFVAPNTPDVGVIDRVYDTWFEGNYILGTDFVYNWQECENLYDDIMNKAMSPYITFATDIYKNKLSSFVDPIEELSDELNFIALKIQHLTSELKPDLIVVNEDALAEISDGTGNSKTEAWQTALDLLGTRGIVIEKTVNVGEYGSETTTMGARPYGVSQGSAITILLNQWAFYYNQLRENTGINPAVDGAIRGDALVGTTQMMQLSGNMVTKNIADTAMEMNKKVCEVISTRINAIYKYNDAHHLRELYNNIVGKHIMEHLSVMKNRHLHEFGFIFRMIPTREDIQRFREDLSIALSNGLISVDVKSEAEYIYRTNPELARQYLNFNIRNEQKRRAEEQMMLARNKSENDAKAAQAKAQAEAQAFQFKSQVEIESYAKKKAIDLEHERKLIELRAESDRVEFERNVYLERIKSETKIGIEDFKEKRKDDRTKIQATQQSKILEQRQKGGEPINFDGENEFLKLIEDNEAYKQEMPMPTPIEENTNQDQIGYTPIE